MLPMGKLKYTKSMTDGKIRIPSVDVRNRFAFIHCSLFFLSKNTHPTAA